MKQDRKISLKPVGLILVLALAAYSLLCVYVSGVSIQSLWKLSFRISEVRRPFQYRSNFNQPFSTARFDNRPMFIKKWSKVLGIQAYYQSKFDTLGYKVAYTVALGCFLLSSLLHSYVFLKTLLQPSYAAGSRGSNVRHKIIRIKIITHM